MRKPDILILPKWEFGFGLEPRPWVIIGRLLVMS